MGLKTQYSNPTFKTLTHHLWTLGLNKEMDNLEENHTCWVPSASYDPGGLFCRIPRVFCEDECSRISEQ